VDTLIKVNVYDANNNAVPGVSVTAEVKFNGEERTLGPLTTVGTKEEPVEFQIKNDLDDPVVKLTAFVGSNCKTELLDTRQRRGTVIQFDSVLVEERPRPPPNPWVGGSFYLLAFSVVVVALIVISIYVAWYFVPAVIVGAILMLTVIGAFTLRGNEQMRDEPFLKLMEMSFRNLPLIKILGRKPKD
jgi:hypothetical protein